MQPVLPRGYRLRPFMSESTREYSAERRQLCQENATARVPVLPALCPNCNAPKTSIMLYMCYNDSQASEWAGRCEHCSIIHRYRSSRAQGEHLKRIKTLVALEKFEKTQSDAAKGQKQLEKLLQDETRKAAREMDRALKKEHRRMKERREAQQKTANAVKRVRKQRAARLAAIQALRDKIYGTKTASKAQAVEPPVQKQIWVVYWFKDDTPPKVFVMNVTKDNKCDLAQEPDLPKRKDNLLQLWDIGMSRWEKADYGPVIIDENTTVLLTRSRRVDRLVHFPEELHLADDIRSDTVEGRKRQLRVGDEYFKKIQAREHAPGTVTAVVYHEDLDVANAFVYALDEDDNFYLLENTDLRLRWEEAKSPRIIDIWRAHITTWERADIMEPISLEDEETTAIVRFHGVDSCSYLGLELFAHANPGAERLPTMGRARRSNSSTDDTDGSPQSSQATTSSTSGSSMSRSSDIVALDGPPPYFRNQSNAVAGPSRLAERAIAPSKRARPRSPSDEPTDTEGASHTQRGHHSGYVLRRAKREPKVSAARDQGDLTAALGLRKSARAVIDVDAM